MTAPLSPVEAITKVLLPCPMCGDTELDGGIYPTDRERTYYRLQCGNPDCRCMMEGGKIEEIRRRWNRRATR